MQRARAIGTRFALHEGYPVDESPFVYLASRDDYAIPGWTGALLILAEPMEPAPGATEAATSAIEHIRTSLAGVASDDAIVTICDAYQTTNERLYRENTRRMMRRRVYIGVTTVILCGNDLYVAQTPPGQLLIRQDDALYAFPRLDSWQPEFQPSRTYNLPNALGLRYQVEPDVYYSQAAPGDLILALSSKIARCIASLEDDVRLAGSVDDALMTVLRTCDRHFVSTGHGAALEIPSIPQRHDITPSAEGSHLPIELQSFDFQAWDSVDPSFDRGEEDRKWDTAPLDPDAFSVQTEDAHEGAMFWLYTEASKDDRPGLDTRSFGAADSVNDTFASPHGSSEVQAYQAQPLHQPSGRRESGTVHRSKPGRDDIWFEAENPRFGGRTRSLDPEDEYDSTFARTRDDRYGTSPGRLTPSSNPRARGPRPLELLAGLLLSLTAAVVGVWQVTKRDRPIHGPLDDGSLGLPRLQRWDESYRPPRMQRLRSRFPRLEVSRVVVLFALLLAVGGGVFFYLSRTSSQETASIGEFSTAIHRIDAHRASAANASSPAAAYDTLMQSSQELDAVAAMDGADANDVAALRAQINADIAAVTGAQRLSNVQVVGGVPAAASGVAPRLISGGGRLYLLSDGLYQVDTFSSTLILLLSPGDIVGDAAVLPLRGATWREDRLVAVDATRSYVYDASRGAWNVEPLGTFDSSGYTSIASADAFDRNLYLLTPESGQILKFQAGGYDGQPEDWTGGLAAEELRRAVDMAIDGHVLVLLEDGRILDFFRSRLEATITPQVIPPMDAAAAIVATPTSNYIYLLHGTDGRIIRLARDGTVVQQFTSPLTGAAPILSNAVDMAVDEAGGVAYILAKNTIYTVRLPAPPAAQE